MAIKPTDMSPTEEATVKSSPTSNGTICNNHTLASTPILIRPRFPGNSKHNRTDAFRALDDLCLHTVITYLSLRDLITCSDVSRLWRRRLDVIITDGKVRSYFPFFNPPPAKACGERVRDLRYLEDRNLAWRDVSLSSGSPTWHCRLYNASRYSVAGNFAVWRNTETSEVNWRVLRQSGGHSDTQKFKLPVEERFPYFTVEEALVNEAGVLFIRGALKGGFGRMYRDQAYLLSQEKLLWCKDTNDPKTTKPLFLSLTSAYFLSTRTNSSIRRTEIVLYAHCIYRGHTLYESLISCNPTQDNYQDVYKLLRLGGRDFIVSLNEKYEFFSIISGETGTVLQQIKHNGLRGCSVIPTPDVATREFILWSPPSVQEISSNGYGEFERRVTRHTFAEQPNGAFVCTNVRTVLYHRGANFVVHPYGDYGFSLSIEGLRILKVVPDKTGRGQNSSTNPESGQQYLVESTKLVPAKEVRVRWWEANRPVTILSQTRIMFDDTAADDRTVHLFEFGPGWKSEASAAV